MSGYTAPSPIIKPYCNSGSQVAPPLTTSTTVANQETGFPPLQATPLNAGGVPVNIAQFNGLLNLYTNQILALVMGYQFTFDANVSTEWNGYPIGFVLYSASDNSYQKSLVNNNTANFVTTPSYLNDQINWTAVVISQIYADSIAFYGALNAFYTSFSSNPAISSNINFQLPPSLPPSGGIGVLNSDHIGVMSLFEYGKVIEAYSPSLAITGSTTSVLSITLPISGRYLINGAVTSGSSLTASTMGIGTVINSYSGCLIGKNQFFWNGFYSTVLPYEYVATAGDILYLTCDTTTGGPLAIYGKLCAVLTHPT